MLSKEEEGIFKAFIATEPNFPGEPVSWSPAADPPDVLCETNKGQRIGVELGEWLHEAQTERARALEILEKEIAKEAVKQNTTQWLDRYGVLLYPKLEVDSSKTDRVHYVFPSKADRPKFTSELFNLLGKFKKPGQPITRQVYLNDFSQAPTLGKFLTGTSIYPVRTPPLSIKFAKGGSYSPEDARAAIAGVLKKKTAKRNYKTLKKEQALNELYLLVYYNRALLWNSPYEGINGGIDIAVEQAKAQMSKDHDPFDKVFLFLAFEPEMKVISLWP